MGVFAREAKEHLTEESRGKGVRVLHLTAHSKEQSVGACWACREEHQVCEQFRD